MIGLKSYSTNTTEIKVVQLTLKSFVMYVLTWELIEADKFY